MDAFGSKSVSYTALASPPWAVTNCASLSSALPSSSTCCNNTLASSTVAARPPAISICAPRVIHNSTKSAGPCPFKVSIASFTSRALPTAHPRGWSMSEITAIVLRPAFLPICTISLARAKASSCAFIKAPLPVFTSSTMASAPAASFLLIMELAISDILSTVAVTSRRAYSFLSAGARSAVCPIMAMPISFTLSINCSVVRDVLKPAKLSSLSMVPPVCPRPLPLILATGIPHAATIGVSAREVLSPTPPVLCLSTLQPLMADKSSMSPLSAIAMVSS